MAGVASTLTEEFTQNAKSAVGLVNVAAHEKDLTVHERSVNNSADGGHHTTIAGGDMITSEAASKNASEEIKLKAKKEKEKTYLAALKDTVKDLDRIVAELNERLEGLKEVRDKLDNAIDALKNGEDITDENGELKDKDLEAKVREYERKNNVKIDRDDPTSLLMVLDAIDEEIAAVVKNLDDALDKRQLAKDLHDGVENGTVSIDEITEEFLSKASIESEELERAVDLRESEAKGQRGLDYIAKEDKSEAKNSEGKVIEPTNNFGAAASGGAPSEKEIEPLQAPAVGLAAGDFSM